MFVASSELCQQVFAGEGKWVLILKQCRVREKFFPGNLNQCSFKGSLFTWCQNHGLSISAKKGPPGDFSLWTEKTGEKN